MDHELLRSITAMVDRLVLLSAEDDGLRDDLRSLAGAVLASTDRPSPVAVAEPTGQGADREDPPRPEPIAIPPSEAGPAIEPAVYFPAAPASRLPELTLGRYRPPEHRVEPRHEPISPAQEVRPATGDAELPAIEARCRLKAEGTRWATTRRRRIEEGAEFRLEIAPRDREILDRARDLECYLWMNNPDFTVPDDPASLENAAGCFEAVADAVALIRGMLPDVEANREFFEPALDVLAEAQSALRVAVDRVGGTGDQDQYRIYGWLRSVASREHFYIRRHMRLDDPADPAHLPQVERRVEALDAKFQEVRGRAKRKKSALNRLRYHAKQIGEGSGGEHDWRKVAGAVHEMVAGGIPASSVEVREILLPIVDSMPDLDDLPSGFGLVVREIDRYLAGRASSPGAVAPETPTREVSEAARLLAGKGVVLIGGYRRPQAHDALKAALGLSELVWIEGRDHASIDRFEPSVARPDMALVLLAIRWSSHSFGEVRRFCERYGKPMVRLPGGYGPNQVASQILAQASEQLRGS